MKKYNIFAEIMPSVKREGNHVTILVGNKPLSENFVPSHLSKDSGLPIREVDTLPERL